MPQIPLFVSSAKAGSASNGSFSVDFQPPLELPETAKNATIQVQQMSVPYTAPNITTKNNVLVVNLPNINRSDIRKLPGSTTTNQRFAITIPPALYTLEDLEAAINKEINHTVSHTGGTAFYKRAVAVTHKTVNADGTDGNDITADPVANWLSFVPDFATNRLHIRLNYEHSSILFSDSGCTMASTLGFSSDILTTAEEYIQLATTPISVDIMWRLKITDAFQQFSVTLPANPTRGYTTAQIKDDLNTLVGDYLYTNHSVGPTLSPFNVMIASLIVRPGDEPNTYKVKMTYTDQTLVMVRGSMYDTTTDTTSLPRGQLRAGLANPSFAGGIMAMSAGFQHIGNPYEFQNNYLAALLNPVADAATGGTTSDTSVSERQTGLFLISCGFAAPGLEIPQPDVDSMYASGMSFFHNVGNLHDAEAGTEPHIDSVTEIGLAVEPIVVGPRDTSGKTSGTLARFVIPKGSRPGDVLAFESANPTRVSVQNFVGTDINRLTFRLVDQHNDPISDLAGEHFSAVVLFSYD
jgi:hypothetical protein